MQCVYKWMLSVPLREALFGRGVSLENEVPKVYCYRRFIVLLSFLSAVLEQIHTSVGP